MTRALLQYRRKRAAQGVLRDAQGPSDKDTDYLREIAAKILLVIRGMGLIQ